MKKTPSLHPANDTEREQAAYRELKKAILAGDYLPGVRLIEREVAARLGVSRSPVRGAFHLLEAEGLLDRTAGRGVAVRMLKLDDVQHILELREALEGMAARLAALRRTPAQLAEMQLLLDQLAVVRTCGDKNSLSTGAQLHRLILASSGNPELERTATRAYTPGMMFSYQLLAAGLAGRDTLSEHQFIVSCIARGDAEGAEASARAHMRATREFMLNAAQTDALQR